MLSAIGIVIGIILSAIVLAGLVSAIIILIEAFKTSVKDGLLSLFVPLYVLYFMFAKLAHPRKTLLIILFMVQPFFVGIYAALGIYGLRKFLVNAKQAEARTAVVQIAQSIVSSTQSRDPGARAELPETTPAVPSSLESVRGTKYMSAPIDWSGAWQQIRFSMATPQYFQYQWERTSATEGVVRARADLDGNGEVDSHFEVPIQCVEQPTGLTCRLQTDSLHEAK